jgi:intraflagellar transport protein 56
MQQVGAGLAVKEAPALPTLDEMIQRQDFTGAVTLLQFQKQAGEGGPLAQPWLAYAHFHLGDYAKALDVYTKLQAEDPANGDYHLYAACCHFYLGHYKEAIAEAKQGAATGSPAKQRLRNRVLMHCAYKVNNTALLDEASAACAHASAQGSIHDALSVAALQFMRCQFQEAADEYQRIIKENLDCDAVNMYIALCLYKLDHFRISLDFVSKYVAKFPDSASALNLRACNHFRVFDSARADADLQLLADKLQSSAHAFGRELVEHNTVVFRGGQDAVKVLPPLLDVVPEARFNLTVHHLRAGELEDALSLVKDLEPKTPQEYVIKAVAYAAIGVANDVRQAVISRCSALSAYLCSCSCPLPLTTDSLIFWMFSRPCPPPAERRVHQGSALTLHRRGLLRV